MIAAPKLSKCLWYSEANVYVDKNHAIFLKYGVHQKVRSMHTANCDNDIFDGIVFIRTNILSQSSMSETLISRSHRFKNLLNPLIWVAIAKAMWGDNLDQMKYQESQKMSHHHKTTQIVRQYFFGNRRSFHFRNSKTIRNGPCMFIPQIACHELRLQISKSAD